jgi:hypothetical protein
MTETCTHSGHSDAAKRISDVATQMWQDHKWECSGKFIAVNLQGGMTSGDLYPSVTDATRFNDPRRHFFLQLHPGGIGCCEAEIMLRFHRMARESGMPQADPDARGGGKTLIPRIGTDDIVSQIRSLSRGY